MGQEEAHSLHHCKHSGAAAARSLAAEAVLAALRSSRSFEGSRCTGEVRSAGSMGRRRGLVGRLVGLEEEVLEEVPSIQYLSKGAGRGFGGGAR